MEFISFADRHEVITRTETRGVEIGEQNEWGIPPGHYAFFESFCIDDACDCRKVMVTIFQIESQQIVATIGYGWERAEFYTAWMYGDEEAGALLVGSHLEPIGLQSPDAFKWLDLWESQIISNETYRARICEHYRIFKKQNGSNHTKL